MATLDAQKTLAGIKEKALGIKSALNKRAAEESTGRPARTLSDVQGEADDFLSSSFAPQKESIMSAYEAARGEIKRASEASRALTTSEATELIGEAQEAGERALTQAQEQQRGFARSPIALSLIASDAEKRMRGIEKARDQLLLQGEFEEASRLAKALTDEQVAISSARVNSLNEFFGLKTALTNEQDLGLRQAQGEREALAFRTPEQAAALELASVFPDAGILPTDDFATAQQKVTGSPSYLQNREAGRLALEQAQANIDATRASTAKTLSSGTDTDIAFEAGQPLFEAYNTGLDVLNDPNLDSILGRVEGRKPEWMLSGDQVNTVRKFDQFIDTLALAARGQLKGQGSITDAETAMLKSAQTALSRTMSESTGRAEIRKVRGVIGLQAGIPQIVKLEKDGQSQVLQITRDGFNQAVADGFQVKFQ